MNTISELEFQKSIAEIYHTVFINENPFDAPFQSSIGYKLLLYKFRYGLSETQPWLTPFTKAVSAMGEDGFYLTLLEREGSEPWHWYVPLHEAHLYLDEIFPLQNAIYSVKGRWGIICSDEDHALLGGPQIMTDIFQESIQNWDDRLESFLNAWKRYHEQNEKIDIAWLPTMLSHIYGTKLPAKILRNPNLKQMLKSD